MVTADAALIFVRVETQHDTHEDELRRSREVAEAAREREWAGAGFLRELFLGRFRFDLIHPVPPEEEERPEFRRFYDALEVFLRNEVEPDRIDELGEYPPAVVDGLRRLGAFGMKIPVEYGGLGFTQREYARAMQLVGSYDANVAALLSAHQSIGVPQPLKLFGSEALKRKYLPRCAAGAISAFALTETAVGSDPARLATTAVPTPDGKAFILNGEKLWCTNGTLAELLVVMARNPATNAITAFVVEVASPGVQVTHRLHFMGLSALANGVIRFDNVRVPRDNVIGGEGKGLKIALTTLNTGRLTLPAAVVGASKVALELCRKWANAREQWGQAIGKHEVIAHKLAKMASTVYAMESLSDLVQSLADQKGYDIRLEAAAAKEWNSAQAWRLVDDALQIRGGRGYERASSLASRGEPPVSVERWMRDARINLIFEGSTEIMHLFMAREAVDKHLQVAGVIIDPKSSRSQKLRALPRIGLFYFTWFFRLVFGGLFRPRYHGFGRLTRHLSYIESHSRKLARQVFYGMIRFGPALERKQGFLFRLVDIANELFVMAATITRARHLHETGRPEARDAAELAHRFCASAQREVDRLFHALWHNDDAAEYRLGREVLDADHEWLEKGSIGLGYSVADLTPVPAARGKRPEKPAATAEPAPFA